MKKSVNKLLLIYYLMYILALIVAVGGFYLAKQGGGFSLDPQSTTGVTITSLYLIFLMASIPLSLRIFNKKVKTLASGDNINEKIKKYTSYALYRLIIIGANLLLGVFFFYLFNSRSMTFCAAIAAIALVFCKPSEAKMGSELEIYEDTDL